MDDTKLDSSGAVQKDDALMLIMAALKGLTARATIHGSSVIVSSFVVGD